MSAEFKTSRQLDADHHAESSTRAVKLGLEKFRRVRRRFGPT